MRTGMFKRQSMRWKGFRFRSMLTILAVFGAIAVILFAERSGVHYTEPVFKIDLIEKTEAIPAENAMFGVSATCLLLYDSTQEGVTDAKEQFDQIMLDMKVGTKSIDISEYGDDAGDLISEDSLLEYETVLILSPNLDAFGEGLAELMDWVEDGGYVMFAMTPEKSSYFDMIAPKLGVMSSSGEYKIAESIVPEEDFMIGGGERYEISDPFESSLSVSLRDSAEVFARTGDDGVPLIWRNALGNGAAVVCNIGVYDKVMRGFYAQAFSLLGDACAWPVINSAVFYLDDFPSPVPGGDGSYIRRDYGLSISDFYSKVWWPDVLQLAEKYGVLYTGVIIENYEDDTEDSPERQKDSEQFKYYGGMLLRHGGEIGYHGYNHQPLCLTNVDYGDEYDYNNWPSESAMRDAVEELIEFRKDILPNAAASVYVPPSNILSDEGRAMLGKISDINTISSTYFEDGTEYPYVQEFGVAADGIVEQPRIVSGSMVGDDFMKLAVVSELNMHFVSTHFMHPDDLLDEDRGAAEGWEVYKGGLEDYMEWLTNCAPELRMQVGTECSASIQRYAALTVSVETTEDAWELELGNLYDEAYLLFRANDGTPGNVSGGTITNISGNLYLLEATDSTVRIERKGA